MLTRFGLGLIKGLLLGGLVLAALFFGASWASVPVWMAYLLVVALGALTGLVAGKPIWQKDAKIEAGLKALVGAILAPAALYALRRWVPLPQLPAPHAVADEVSVIAFPAVSVVIAMLFELDNSPSPEGEAQGAGQKGASGGKVRVGASASQGDELDDLELPPASQQANRRGGRR